MRDNDYLLTVAKGRDIMKKAVSINYPNLSSPTAIKRRAKKLPAIQSQREAIASFKKKHKRACHTLQHECGGVKNPNSFNLSILSPRIWESKSNAVSEGVFLTDYLEDSLEDMGYQSVEPHRPAHARAPRTRSIKNKRKVKRREKRRDGTRSTGRGNTSKLQLDRVEVLIYMLKGKLNS